MTAHTYHPDTHEHGLADGCPRCAEHAQYPARSLDETNVRNLLDRIENNLEPRSKNEARAMANLARIAHERERWSPELRHIIDTTPPADTLS